MGRRDLRSARSRRAKSCGKSKGRGWIGSPKPPLWPTGGRDAGSRLSSQSFGGARMNILSYDCSDANGLSFALRVDGQPLAALIGGMEREIPVFLVGDDLARPSGLAVAH